MTRLFNLAIFTSPLLYRYTLFPNCPVIPALFLIHERKFRSVHEKFMQCLADLVPSLVKGKRNVPLVTDKRSCIKLMVGILINSKVDYHAGKEVLHSCMHTFVLSFFFI